MNNLSGHLSFASSDTHFGRIKRKKDTVSDTNGNGFDALHLRKKRCLGISSYTNDHNNHVNDVDMSDTSHATTTFQVGANNSNAADNSTGSNGSLQHKQERYEVRSFCRPHWKGDFYEFGPFF